MDTKNEDAVVKDYLRKIGRKGGQKSRRVLRGDHARRMVAVREAQRAFREHKAACFWSFGQEWKIGIDEVPLVIRTLRQEGNRRAFEQARRIQRLWGG